MSIWPTNKPPAFREFITYDLEWVPGSLKLRVVGVYDGNRYKHYLDMQSFLNDWLIPSNSGKWFYAHSGGMADIQFVFETIYPNKDYSIDATFSGSSAIIVNISRGEHKWTFVDSLWLFRTSLASIGRSLGMEKTGPADNPNWTREQIKDWYANVPLPELIEYNENDCVILWHAINEFQQRLLGLDGQLQMTIASCAMMLFRRRYLKETIYTANQTNRIGRECYFASRVEVFNERCNDAYYYDINSSFPYAMTQPLPGSLKLHYSKLKNRHIENCDTKPILAQASVYVPDTYFPPLATRINGRLFFPTGSWRGWFTGIDLKLLLENGGSILSVGEAIEFEPMTCMRDYATDIYDLRKKSSDPFERIVLKYLLNSLYGKTAERTEKQQLYIRPPKRILQKLDWTNMLRPGVFLVPTDKYVPHEHTPIAAYVTSIARRTLFNFMKTSSEFHYCDTDGFSSKSLHDTSNELGGLKLEKKIKAGHFVLPKVYKLDALVLNGDRWEDKTITKAKGFSLSKDKIECASQFATLVNGGEIYVDRMRRIRENLRKGSITPFESVITKSLNPNMVKKRHTHKDGSTRPWTLTELRRIYGID